MYSGTILRSSAVEVLLQSLLLVQVEGLSKAGYLDADG